MKNNTVYTKKSTLDLFNKVISSYNNYTDPPIYQPILDPKDKEHTNLYVGKIIDDESLTCEVVMAFRNNIHIKILENRDLTFALDVGKTYPVYRDCESQ